jgi:hypothetical protein
MMSLSLLLLPSCSLYISHFSSLLSSLFLELELLKVVDSVFVGGNEDGVVRAGQEYSVPFPFGCMTSVSGLFETQLADGIMALSR